MSRNISGSISLNTAPVDPWGNLKDSFQSRIQELRRYINLRLDDRCKDSFEKELKGIDATVRALEQKVQDVKSHLANEKATIPKVEAIIAASTLQANDLNAISSNLPPHLPGNHSTSSDSSNVHASMGRASQYDGATAGSRAQAQSGVEKKRKDVAPRAFITERELNSLSSYMRGRLTLDKVNAAIDEIGSCAEANQRLMAAARATNSKLSGAERKRAVEALHSIANKEGVKGKFWFLDADLKEGAHIRPDKTGKSILMILRHLGRLQEVRASMEGSSIIVYVLN